MMARSDAAQQIIRLLRLEPLPHEGGFYRQTWCSEAGSAILFLITEDAFSALHRLDSTEIWHFHAGDAVEHVQLDPATGELRVTRLGSEIFRGDTPQCVVPGGVWQGARWASGSAAAGSAGYALLGCTMAPAWDEARFELGNRDALVGDFPAAKEWIRALTR
jgi:predicted cupin superfamily sugar epimerase